MESRTDLHRGEAVHSLVIVIRDHAFPLVITERMTKVPHEPTPQEIRRQERNPWHRAPKYDKEFDGRLVLSAPPSVAWRHSYSHGDGARWTLESRLGHLLRDLEDRAVEAEHRQREQEHREAEKQRQWYAAIAQARTQQVDRHRAAALIDQVKGWRQAAEIRAFCQAVRARTDNGVPAGEEEWLQWAEAYAARIDPLRLPLTPPPDPPADRVALRELLEGDLHAYSWPFDSEGRWTLHASEGDEVHQGP